MPTEPSSPAFGPPFPIGQFTPADNENADDRRGWIADLADLPSQLRDAVDGLSDAQLDVKYRNWTVRQIVHHIADSHVNSYVRFKWALTEDTPTIKAYDEGLWSDLSESQTGKIAPSLNLLDGLHLRWCQLLEKMTPAQYARTFVHPETGDAVSLDSALAYYAWHGKHHTGQISWLRRGGHC